jgi:hypothetical protein
MLEGWWWEFGDAGRGLLVVRVNASVAGLLPALAQPDWRRALNFCNEARSRRAGSSGSGMGYCTLLYMVVRTCASPHVEACVARLA